MSGKIGREFIEKTKYKYLGVSDQMRGYPVPPVETMETKGKKRVPLPNPRDISLPDMPLRTAIEKRESIREYTDIPLSLEELSYLLWCTQGVKEVIGNHSTLRNVPSAGARHALETYLLVHRVSGLSRGLYRFMAIDHCLVHIETDSTISRRMREACLNQDYVELSAVTFIWVTVPYRMIWRYGERGYRYLFLDAGHACQNLYLSAESIGCGVCAIGAFFDEEVNRLMNLDGETQFVIYMATVGKK